MLTAPRKMNSTLVANFRLCAYVKRFVSILADRENKYINSSPYSIRLLLNGNFLEFSKRGPGICHLQNGRVRFLGERLGTAFPHLFWSWERRSHTYLWSMTKRRSSEKLIFFLKKVVRKFRLEKSEENPRPGLRPCLRRRSFPHISFCKTGIPGGPGGLGRLQGIVGQRQDFEVDQGCRDPFKKN